MKFIQSIRARRRAVPAIRALYREVLEREPDEEGLLYYVSRLADGRLSLDALAAALRGSDEYRRRSAAKALWTAWLDRPPPAVRIDLPQRPDRVAVIVEPRRDRHLARVVRNVVTTLGPDWGLQVYHGRLNGDFVREATEGIRNVDFVDLGVDNLSGRAYVRCVTSKSFWQSVRGDKVLVFQTDVVLRRGNVEEFIEQDYIGAPWAAVHPQSGTRVGNGGLSLRTRQVMIDIASRHRARSLAPDVFFSKHVHEGGYRLASPELAARFAVENVFHPDPLGLHKAYMELVPEQLALLLEGIDKA